MKEIWKKIELYEEYYQISSIGRVKSVERKSFNGNVWFIKKEKLLNQFKNKNGYLSVSLCKDGKSKRFYIHRLVATAFLKKNKNIPNKQVNHKNGIKTDNRYCNLEWCSPSENIIHSYKVLKRHDSKETRLKKSLSKRGEKNFFFGKNPTQFRRNIIDCQDFIKKIKKNEKIC